MYIRGREEWEHHRNVYGSQDRFGYKDFIPMFKGENLRAGEWAELIRKAGARYIVPVAEHHDGFQMYKSRLSRWNSQNMGPGRDILGEWKKAVGEDGQVRIRSLGVPDTQNGEGVFFGRIRSVSILGSKEKPFWKQEKDGLHVQTYGVKSSLPVVVKVQVL